MDSSVVLLAVFFITCFLISLSLGLGRRRKLPPGPFPLPIIGNMLQIGAKPHESFTQLSKKYGPLMSIHLGSLYNVVVSSPEMAKEILQKHGQVFSGRPILQAVHSCDHDMFSIGFLPVADTAWRGMRKLCKEEMFSHTSMEASEGLRQQKLQQLLDYVQKCSDTGRAVDVREAAFITTINLMSATLFSAQATEFDSELCRELKESVEGVMSIVGLANYADFFPFLKRFDLQGIKRRADVCLGKLLGVMEGYLSERLESRRTNPVRPRKNDLLEKLVDIIEGDEHKFTTHHIMHLMMDLFVGASETSSTTLEWIMSELVANPDKLGKAKDEVKRVAGEKKLLEESDMARLPYLQAVVKEVLRIHPPGPFLVPRRAESDETVNGYLIPKGTQILVNAWAMGRDPSIWKNPDSFEPQRFIDLKTDYKGQDFELIPFGSGRRICPGMPLADRLLHMTIATLVHNFDWKLERGADPDQHRKAELSGGSLRRAAPLRIIPFKP